MLKIELIIAIRVLWAFGLISTIIFTVIYIEMNCIFPFQSPWSEGRFKGCIQSLWHLILRGRNSSAFLPHVSFHDITWKKYLLYLKFHVILCLYHVNFKFIDKRKKLKCKKLCKKRLKIFTSTYIGLNVCSR